MRRYAIEVKADFNQGKASCHFKAKCQQQVQAFERVLKPNRDYLWPIPQKELDLNAGLTQNPGW